MLLECTEKMTQNETDIQIKEISVYLDFQDRGYTTAGAYTHFDDLEKKSVQKIKLTEGELNVIEITLNNATQKKHRQTKFGGNLIFCKIKFTDKKIVYSRVIISIGQDKILICDLTKMVTFEIKDSNNRQLLLNIVDKLKK